MHIHREEQRLLFKRRSNLPLSIGKRLPRKIQGMSP
ncbi:hypothetical protein APH_1234 [Anaplasma phagocytophilum str. HZ]|uniref:Uncharacterized protein n=1 Tax=Anaplasma phagocytophilum (strain HZ) TaxID=212042 RepID=Q2GIN8_ANAPZ|nr:hypothetical protein APH_1234 [Anaplasma phagocytophilum str. HZ]